MMRISTFLAFLFCVCSAFSQDKGYFSRTTFIDLDLNGSAPLFQNIFEEKGYINSAGKLKESYNLFDYGFRASLGAVTKGGNAIAFEYAFRNYQFNPLDRSELNRTYLDAQGNLINNYIYPKVGFVNVREHIYMPKYIFVSDLSQVPAGFSNEIGIGYSVVSVEKNKALVEYSQGTGGFHQDSIAANLVNPNSRNLNGMTFMYGFRMNYPLTKSLLFHIGFRYSYNLLFGRKASREAEISEYWLSEREIWSRVNQRRLLGIASFSTGLTICF